MPSLAESLLAVFVGCGRAAAIMGDLSEMAATRGGLWFVAAYARTLFSLTWRMLLALVIAVACRQTIFDLFHVYIQHTPAIWRANTGSFLNLLNASGPLLACIMSTLWFALPFAAIRYGHHDPFVRLTFVLTIGTTIAFLAIPWISLLDAVVTLIIAFAALLSRAWRKPFEVLAWTGGVGILTLATFTVGARQFLAQHQAISLRLASHPLAASLFALAFQGSLLLIAIVCSRLHTLLLPSPPRNRDLA